MSDTQRENWENQEKYYLVKYKNDGIIIGKVTMNEMSGHLVFEEIYYQYNAGGFETGRFYAITTSKKILKKRYL